jgi:sugar/nucleoside kinase (ribokinase family)
LHQQGALAIDINAESAYYCPVPKEGEDQVINTAGAGDVFRGAFCYALLKYSNRMEKDFDLMKACTEFGIRIASEKCKELYMSRVFEKFGKLSQELLPS